MIGDCSVSMISPDMYVEFIRPLDIDFALFCKRLAGGNSDILLHHCDTEADRYLDAYAAIPHVRKLQASHRTDIGEAAQKLPDASFCAMVSPWEINKLRHGDFERLFGRAIRLGSGELDLWNIDMLTPPDRLREIFGIIMEKSKVYGAVTDFDVLPFVWDELEWAYPAYQDN